MSGRASLKVCLQRGQNVVSPDTGSVPDSVPFPKASHGIPLSSDVVSTVRKSTSFGEYLEVIGTQQSILGTEKVLPKSNAGKPFNQ